MPSIKLRKLEIAANEAFDTYREMYYEGGVSSVYLWDLDEGGFAGVVLLKKSTSFTHPFLILSSGVPFGVESEFGMAVG